MKLSYSQKQKLQGGVLIATLITAIIFGGVLAAYLVMVSTSQKATVRSETWNRALPLGEAGIEEAMAHLNRNYPANMLTAGWALNGGRLAAPQRTLGDGYYKVSMTMATNPVIYATGGALMPVDKTYLERTIRVQTVQTCIVQNAISTRYGIKLNGNKISTDSYDSMDSRYSNGAGKYDPHKALDHGDIASNLGIEEAMDLGNANIKGRVHTGPNGSVAAGPNTSVGDAAWVGGGSTGIKEGYFSDDMNAPFPEVTAPFAFEAGTTPTSGRVGPDTFDCILGNGNYSVRDFKGKVLVTGDAVLLVSERCQFTGTDFIRIMPGASLKLYVACATANIGGQGVVNMSDRSTSFSYMGLPSNTAVSIKGNGELSGFIYAPSAAITLQGGGNVYGAIMGASLTIGGTFAFHFDEALRRQIKIYYFTITSWDEI